MKLTSPLGGIQQIMVRQKQLQKALFLVLFSVSDYKRLDTRLDFIIINFHRKRASGKGQPWYEFSSICTAHNVRVIMDN